MSLHEQDANREIEYPASDGEPMAETDIHIRLMSDLRFALEQFFRQDQQVYVSANLFVYYVEGDSRKRVAPDVFVAKNVGNRLRRVYKIWEEKQPPDVVIEISSRQTWGQDMQRKWGLYERLGVREYFIFDPEYDYLPAPLVGYRLNEGQYEELEAIDGRLHSEALGLDLVDTGETLRLFDPNSGRFLLTADEAMRAVEEEAAARRAVEEENARLREELERLRRE